MVDAMRAMLDELMGKERNVPLAQRSGKSIHFDDPAVCKYALAGLCPHGLFKNTRSDLGPCAYEYHEDHIEWENIQAGYDTQSAQEKERYERRLLKYLEDLIREMDRKVVKAKERAAAESAPKPIKPDDQARLADMQAKAKELLEKSQQAGEFGDVDISMALTQQAEEVKAQHDRLYKQLSAPDRSMMVCETCGVFINSTDNEQRRQDHLTGKQYLGWKAIRDKHLELQQRFEAPPRLSSRDERPAHRDERVPGEERPRDHRSSRERGPDEPRRDRERERSPARGREYRERDGSGRDRDYHGERHREYPDRPPRDMGYPGRGERDQGRSRGNEVAPPRDLYNRGSRGYEDQRRRY